VVSADWSILVYATN